MLTRIVSNTKFGSRVYQTSAKLFAIRPQRNNFSTEVKQDTEPPTGYKTKQYTSHLVLCHGARGPELWPRDIDMMTGLTSAITTMNRKELKDKKITVTACDIGSKSASNIDHSFDLLHFTPNSIKRITSFTHEKLNLLKLYLETGVADPELHTETLPQSHKYIFICTHSARDERCGKCGPPVIKTIGTICKGRNDVTVAGTSHIGGHVWAANMIVYPRGQWYGRLDPNSADFERVIKSALNDEKPPEYHDRGIGFI
jgi:hypothetical protein